MTLKISTPPGRKSLTERTGVEVKLELLSSECWLVTAAKKQEWVQLSMESRGGMLPGHVRAQGLIPGHKTNTTKGQITTMKEKPKEGRRVIN